MKNLKILVPIINEKELYIFKNIVADKKMLDDGTYMFVNNNGKFLHPEIQIYNEYTKDQQLLRFMSILFSKQIEDIDCDFIGILSSKSKVIFKNENILLNEHTIYVVNRNFQCVNENVAYKQNKKLYELLNELNVDINDCLTPCFLIIHKKYLSDLRLKILDFIQHIKTKFSDTELQDEHTIFLVKHILYMQYSNILRNDISKKLNASIITQNSYCSFDNDFATTLVNMVLNPSNTVTAIIPVRAGSRRLKDKNIMSLNGTTLLENKIEQLKRSKLIDNIVVSSDSDHYLEIARRHGVMPHKRSFEYCDEKTKSFGEVVSHICQNVPGKIIIWATCTCPFIDTEDFDEALRIFSIKYLWNIVRKKSMSLMSFERIKRYLWDNDKPINYSLGKEHIPSLQLPDTYIPTFGIAIAKREDMIKWNYLHGDDPIKFIVDKKKAIDIDDEFDYKVALAML